MPLDSKATAIQPPPRKRLRTEDGGGEAASASNLHASVSALLELPLDVLLEILTHVDPMSLRHVSRTSQALRDTLTGPRSNWIWRASYANTDHGLPPAPEDITVPQFLSLLVDQFCDACLSRIPGSQGPIRRNQENMGGAYQILQTLLILQTVYDEDMTRFSMVRDIKGFFGPQYPLYKIFPASEPYNDRCTYRQYPRVLVQRLVNEFLCDTDGKSEGDKRAWIIRRAEKYESVIKDLDIDVDEPEAFKKEFKRLLVTPPRPSYYKIDKYSPRPVLSTPIEIYNLVREGRPLTEEDWSTIRDWLLQAAKAEKRRQILEGRYSAFKKAYYQFLDLKSRREQCMLPSICTLANWEEVVDLIEGTSLEQDLSAIDMRAFVDGLAQTRFSEWRAAFEAELVAKLNATEPEREHPATTADLHLATSVFSLRDSVSGWPVWYPELLSRSPLAWGMGCPKSSYHAVRKCPPWSAREVQADGWRRRLAARLVVMAGLDPATATDDDMGARHVWFARADDVAMLHHGKRAYLMSWHLAMLGAQEGDEYVIFRDHDEVCRARAFLADPSALVRG
ncbi:hypothetical protein FB107DRAFT_250486 [Schizophyllum commune]